jgi:hypothetical protein
MDEPVDVVLRDRLSDAFCALDVYILEREVP